MHSKSHISESQDLNLKVVNKAHDHLSNNNVNLLTSTLHIPSQPFDSTVYSQRQDILLHNQTIVIKIRKLTLMLRSYLSFYNGISNVLGKPKTQNHMLQ